MADVLQIVGGIAGIGGLALGVLLYVFRDIISRKIFPTLRSTHATILLGAMIVLTFAVAVLGIFAGLAGSTGALPFILLVVVILGFVIAVLLIATRFFSTRPSRSAEEDFLVRVGRLVEAGQLDQAERELSRAPGQHQGTSRLWYWRARIALARDNVDGVLVAVVTAEGFVRMHCTSRCSC